MTTKKRGIASVLVATIVTVMTLYVVSTVHMIVKFEQRRKMQVDEIHIYRTKINTNSKFNKEKKQISASRRDKDISHILPPRKMASTTNPIYFLHIGKVRIISIRLQYKVFLSLIIGCLVVLCKWKPLH
ncbi:MAG: hypothetical protein ACI8RD_001772 [Bacillariaceae sp.]|jgi:hypothetical protein